jgi:hypothetical protein
MERAITIIVILAILALVGFALFGPKGSSPGGGAAQAQREARFTLTEYQITPNRVEIQSGRVKLVFVNQGKIVHQIELYDTVEQRVLREKAEFIRPGETQVLWVDLVGGRRYQMYDPIWRNKGMEALLITR